MKNLILGVFVLTFFASQQSQACAAILCEAVCAKYKLTQDSVPLGANGEDGIFSGGDIYKLVNSRAVYIDGEKHFTEIFNELKEKCSGSDEVLFAPNEKYDKFYYKFPSKERLTPSKVCTR